MAIRFKGDLVWREQKVQVHLHNDEEVIFNANLLSWSCKDGGESALEMINLNGEIRTWSRM